MAISVVNLFSDNVNGDPIWMGEAGGQHSMSVSVDVPEGARAVIVMVHASVWHANITDPVFGLGGTAMTQFEDAQSDVVSDHEAHVFGYIETNPSSGVQNITFSKSSGSAPNFGLTAFALLADGPVSLGNTAGAGSGGEVSPPSSVSVDTSDDPDLVVDAFMLRGFQFGPVNPDNVAQTEIASGKMINQEDLNGGWGGSSHQADAGATTTADWDWDSGSSVKWAAIAAGLHEGAQDSPPRSSFTDDFDRGSENLDASSDWEKFIGSDDATVNNGLTFPHARLGYKTDFAISSVDQFAEVEISPESFCNIGPCVRITGSDEYYTLSWREDNLRLRLAHVDSTDDLTVIQDEFFNQTPAAPFTLRLEAEGTTLRGFIDGELHISTTDSTISSGDKVGIYNRGPDPTDGTAANIDSFSAGTTFLDAGGDPVIIGSKNEIRNRIHDLFHRTAQGVSRPTNLHLALLGDIQGDDLLELPAAGNYARVAYDSQGAPTGGEGSNTSGYTFPQPTTEWSVVGVAMVEGSSIGSGRVWGWIEYTQTRTVTPTDRTIGVGNFISRGHLEWSNDTSGDPDPGAAQGFDNEPSDFARIAEWGGEGPPSVDGFGHWEDGEGALVDAADLPETDSNRSEPVAREAIIPDQMDDGSGTSYARGWSSAGISGDDDRDEVYIATWLRIGREGDVQFENHGVVTKLWYNSAGRTSNQNHHFIGLDGGSAGDPQSEFNLVIWITAVDSSGQLTSGVKRSQNVNTSKIIKVGQWHFVELWLRANNVDPLAQTQQQDGAYKIWVDGTLIHDRNNVMFRGYTDSLGFYRFHGHMIWGGNDGSIKQGDDYIQVGHIYISSK